MTTTVSDFRPVRFVIYTNWLLDVTVHHQFDRLPRMFPVHLFAVWEHFDRLELTSFDESIERTRMLAMKQIDLEVIPTLNYFHCLCLGLTEIGCLSCKECELGRSFIV